MEARNQEALGNIVEHFINQYPHLIFIGISPIGIIYYKKICAFTSAYHNGFFAPTNNEDCILRDQY